ncbi:MFS transporter [Actinocatenispora rupis]|uniref:MFS transporter n=1 Tax=Actinocatenispora rupis TaxID=519421 RepID=A0A8J3J815_9ACTN|nr:MFS transporter [Actinocatenispora rupis]GID10083.1 MFS transporter [Actinocatenispora rupis]
MTTACVTPARPALLSRALLLRCVSIVGSSLSFYLLLSVAPLYATATHAGDGAAGIATGALMVATVAGELACPRLVARHGYRRVLVAGLVLLGAPALVLTVAHSMAWIVAVCLVRGLGYAVTVVAGGALTAELVPAERRGEGLALVGVVSAAPSLAALPLGVWLAGHVGYTVVAVAAGVAALASIAAIPGLPDRRPAAAKATGIVAGLRTGALARPAVVFAATASAAGVLVTFLPLAAPRGATGTVALALLVQPAAATVARWLAGRYGDRYGAGRLVLPGLLASAAGILLTALLGSPLALVAGVTLFGLGFGVAQNATLTLMYSRVPTSGYGTVSALWNVAYDAGMGAGALGFGAVVGTVGYAPGFALTGVLMLVALAPALRDRRAR